MRKVGRVFYKKGRIDNKKNQWQEKKKDEEGNCKKPRHHIADYPI